MKLLKYFTVLLLGLLFSCQKEAETNLPPVLKITSISPESVLPGDQVAIRGSGFGTDLSAIVVTINEIELEILQLSDTLIIVLIPETATSGKIEVVVNGENIASSQDLTIEEDNAPEPESDGSWIRRADYPGSLEGDHKYYSSFVIEGKGYYFRDNELWQYSPGTDTWAQRKSLPSARRINYGFGFVIAGKAYIGLGAAEPGQEITGENTGVRYNEVWMYDANTNDWTRRNNFPGSPRVNPFSFSIGSYGYIGGGDSSNFGLNPAADVWQYSPSDDTWMRMANFPGSRTVDLTGTSNGGAGYVVELGYQNNAFYEYNAVHIWKYIAVEDKWERKAKLPTSTIKYTSGVLFPIENNLYLGAGTWSLSNVEGEESATNFWKYDPVTDVWTRKKDIGGGLRIFGAGFAIGQRGYIGVGTGVTSDELKKDFWEFQP